MSLNTLADWLAYIPPPHIIEPGLTRCREVAQRLELLPPNYRSVIVAGTNGKGSSVAMLDAIFRAAGLRGGYFISPHVLRYNERISIDGEMVSDADLCAAFAAIEQARGEIFISNFEFSALAALVIFQRAGLDIAVLEVGLGGRLDATNIVDADAALLTTIDLDHCEWLGDTREAIGYEKAGVLRGAQIAVCSDPQPPDSVLAHAQQLGTRLQVAGQDFHWHTTAEGWRWQRGATVLDLPHPGLAGEHQLANAAGVVAVVMGLNNTPSPPWRGKNRIEASIASGLCSAFMLGRWQRLAARVPVFLDVAHNPQGVQAVVDNMRRVGGEWQVLLGMQKDKDIAASIALLKPHVVRWHVCTLPPPRGATAAELARHLDGAAWVEYPSVAAAWQQLMAELSTATQLLVMGSFTTVAAVLESAG